MLVIQTIYITFNVYREFSNLMHPQVKYYKCIIRIFIRFKASKNSSWLPNKKQDHSLLGHLFLAVVIPPVMCTFQMTDQILSAGNNFPCLTVSSLRDTNSSRFQDLATFTGCVSLLITLLIQLATQAKKYKKYVREGKDRKSA